MNINYTLQLLEIRRQHQQSLTPLQVQPSQSQPTSSYVVTHQLLFTLTEPSLSGIITTTIQEPSVVSEISGVNKHDLLLSSNNTSTTPCDIEFEESMIKSILPDNAS